MVFGALGLAVVITGVSAAFLYLSNQDALRAAGEYQSRRHALQADLVAAKGRGFTDKDLQPVTSRVSQLDRAPPPLWTGDRSRFYKQQATLARQLEIDLSRQQQQVLQAAQTDASKQLVNDTSGLDHSRQIGVDDADLESLFARLKELVKAQTAAHSVTDYRSVSREAQALAGDLARVSASQEAENADLQKAADALKGQAGVNLDAIRHAGRDAVNQGRNDAAIAAYLNKSSPFKGFEVLGKTYARLERYAPTIDSQETDVVVLSSAAAQRYAGQLHDALMAGMPSKSIIVSYAGQHLWAYENGKLVQETPVTTGRPALPTDLGPMKVLKKDSPWKMHSPWPKGSPYWYPDTVVQRVVWFTNTGEGLHDASWQQCCWGPGSQYTSNASHGCIHLPDRSEAFLYNWASIGTPVVVYPGNGSLVNDQLSQITTDDQGNPLSGPKGA